MVPVSVAGGLRSMRLDLRVRFIYAMEIVYIRTVWGGEACAIHQAGGTCSSISTHDLKHFRTLRVISEFGTPTRPSRGSFFAFARTHPTCIRST